MLERKYKIDLNKANFRQLQAHKVQFEGPGLFASKSDKRTDESTFK